MMKSNAEFALEHLLCEMHTLGVSVTVFNQGYGAAPGLEYLMAGGLYVAGANAPGGLATGANLSARLAGVIRAHCALFYALRTGA